MHTRRYLCTLYSLFCIMRNGFALDIPSPPAHYHLSEMQKSLLKSAFQKYPFLSKESRVNLANETGLEEAFISKWFARERRRLSNKYAKASWQGTCTCV